MNKEKQGNQRIAFTAQAIALMRAEESSDKYSKYFVSKEIARKYLWIKKIVPKKSLKRIFQRRIALSKELDDFITFYKPEQIVELACGYSTRGLILTQKNKNLVYVETDFEPVIEAKKKILSEIAVKEKIKLSKNHLLIPLDVIKHDLSSLKKLLSRNKKTLIVAETLVSYLDEKQHAALIENTTNFLSLFKHSAYLTHETKYSMTSGLFGRLLLLYRDLIAKTRSFRHFNNPQEIRDYFVKKGFKKIKLKESETTKNIVYLAEK